MTTATSAALRQPIENHAPSRIQHPPLESLLRQEGHCVQKRCGPIGTQEYLWVIPRRATRCAERAQD